MVIIVPKIPQYKYMDGDDRYEIVSKLNISNIKKLDGLYPHKEVMLGVNDAKILLYWVIKNEDDDEIKKLAQHQIKYY